MPTGEGPVKYFSGDLKPFGKPSLRQQFFGEVHVELGIELVRVGLSLQPEDADREERRADDGTPTRELDEPRTVHRMTEGLADLLLRECRVQRGVSRHAHVHVVQ